MKFAVALAALLCVCGCEDTYVREHIIDNFVCVYMPWWMGECDGEEVTTKVMGVLDHGLVEASVTCEDLVGGGDSRGYSYSAKKFVDGASFASAMFYDRGGTAVSLTHMGQGSNYCARSEDCAAEMLAQVWLGPQVNGLTTEGTFTRVDFTVGSGDLTITYQSITPPSAPDPWVERTVDISEDCTGFNLEAFE